MALKEYGVWTGKAVKVRVQGAEEDSKSPHIYLSYNDSLDGESGSNREAAISVKSQSAISEVVLYLDQNFKHPITEKLAKLKPGFLKLENKPNSLALDYIRGNLIKDMKTGRILPHDIPGKANDVLDLVKPLLEAAVDRGATIHLFGEPYTDHQGIHDVHMNQGSVGDFARFNGVFQDGAAFIQNSDGTYTAILIAFASQAAHTDEISGDAVPGSCNLKQIILNEPCGDSVEPAGEMNVALVGALVNPIGPEGTPAHTGRPETVWLMNRSPKPVNLKGWSILNKAEQVRLIAEEVILPTGGIHAVEMGNVPLSNKGGLLTLLDDKGIKIDGVSYTKQQAQKEGYVVIFR